LSNVFFVLGQDRNADLRELICDFLHAARVCAHRRKGEKYVCRSVLASYQQFKRRCTLEISDTTLDQHAQRVAQLCGLDVHPPTIRLASEKMQGTRNV